MILKNNRPRSYAAVILACSRGGRPEEARRFFDEMDGRDGACVGARVVDLH